MKPKKKKSGKTVYYTSPYKEAGLIAQRATGRGTRQRENWWNPNGTPKGSTSR